METAVSDEKDVLQNIKDMPLPEAGNTSPLPSGDNRSSNGLIYSIYHSSRCFFFYRKSTLVFLYLTKYICCWYSLEVQRHF